MIYKAVEVIYIFLAGERDGLKPKVLKEVFADPKNKMVFMPGVGPKCNHRDPRHSEANSRKFWLPKENLLFSNYLPLSYLLEDGLSSKGGLLSCSVNSNPDGQSPHCLIHTLSLFTY